MRGIPFILPFLLLVAAVGGAARPPDMLTEDVSVSVLPTPVLESCHSANRCLVRVRNHSRSETRVVDLEAEASSWGAKNIVRRRIKLAPGSEVELPFDLPWSKKYINQAKLSVRVDGVACEKNLRLDIRRGYYSGATTLFSKRLGGDPLAAFGEYLGAQGGSHSPTAYAMAPPLGEWLRDWRGLADVDVFLITMNEYRSAPEDARNALRQYVLNGGNLVVFDGDEKAFAGFDHGFGSVAFFDIPTDWAAFPFKSIKVLGDQGHGKFLLCPRESIDINRTVMRLVDDISVPLLGLFLLMMSFSILVGPVSLWWLKKRKRPMWLLWVVPSLSLGFSFLVVSFSLFSEGVTGSARMRSVTVVDESGKTFNNFALQGYYAPIAPFSGLRFDSATDFTLCGADDDLVMDETNGQRLVSGWIKSRMPAFFVTRKGGACRWRLNFDGDGVMNGYGVGIKKLYVSDSDGNLRMTGDISPGMKRELKALDKRVSRSPAPLRGFASWLWNGGSPRQEDEVLTFMPKDCYLAVLEEPLFNEKALSNSNWRDDCGIYVLGLPEGWEK